MCITFIRKPGQLSFARILGHISAIIGSLRSRFVLRSSSSLIAFCLRYFSIFPAAMPVSTVMKVMKSHLKKAKIKRPSGYTLMSADEKDQLRQLQDKGKTPTQVAELMGRDLSTVNRHFKRNSGELPVSKRSVGHPPSLTPKQIDRLVKTTEQMTRAAGDEYDVTASMLRTALKFKCTDRVVLNALHSRGITSHKRREKPVLTTDDVTDRRGFGDTFGSKPSGFWGDGVQAYIDNKKFPVYATPVARRYARKRAAKRSFRSKGQGLATGHTKAPKNLKQNFGHKSVEFAVAISAKKVLMCHEVKGNWTGTAAAKMYTSALAPALRRASPGKRKFLILEDNDPTGYKSKAGLDAKRKEKIGTLDLPKRSPDLNPLDYAFWSEVNRRLRHQEASFPESKRETRDAFIARVKKTMMRIPRRTLAAMVKQMRARCLALSAAKGKHFEEPPPRRFAA